MITLSSHINDTATPPSVTSVVTPNDATHHPVVTGNDVQQTARRHTPVVAPRGG